MRVNIDPRLRVRREIEHFKNLSHIWWGAKTPAGQRRYENKADLMFNLCKVKPEFRILEIGCGDGEFTKRLEKIGAWVVATDITPSVLVRGQKFVKGRNIIFLRENAENLSFKSNYFDIVCGISILHHVQIRKALKEAHRVLKSGGKIFFTEPNLLNPHIFLGLHIPWLRSRMEFSSDETALTRWQVAGVLKKIGFKRIVVRNYDFLHPSTPTSLIWVAERMGWVFERMPLVKEISGSLLIWATK